MTSRYHRGHLGISVLALALLSACSAGSPSTVTISDAISGIQTDLTKAGVISTSHVQDWTAVQIKLFDTNIHALQCSQHVQDPVVAMISGPVTLSLSGSFTSSGSFSVSSSGAMPVFGLQADASRTKGQTLDLPVQFVPLSALPDAEMAREVGYAGNLLAQSDAVRQAEGTRIMVNRDALSHHIRTLIGSFTGACTEAPVHPFVGLQRKP